MSSLLSNYSPIFETGLNRKVSSLSTGHDTFMIMTKNKLEVLFDEVFINIFDSNVKNILHFLPLVMDEIKYTLNENSNFIVILQDTNTTKIVRSIIFLSTI